MITIQQYFQLKVLPAEIIAQFTARAEILLDRVNKLVECAISQGVDTGKIDPDTGCQISGTKGGSGDGGFRTPGTKTGAVNSKHKQAQAVDVYDPNNALDKWLTDEILEQFGLYRESPDFTKGWCHLQSVAPGSGKRTYKPF